MKLKLKNNTNLFYKFLQLRMRRHNAKRHATLTIYMRSINGINDFNAHACHINASHANHTPTTRISTASAG